MADREEVEEFTDLAWATVKTRTRKEKVIQEEPSQSNGFFPRKYFDNTRDAQKKLVRGFPKQSEDKSSRKNDKSKQELKPREVAPVAWVPKSFSAAGPLDRPWTGLFEREQTPEKIIPVTSVVKVIHIEEVQAEMPNEEIGERSSTEEPEMQRDATLTPAVESVVIVPGPSDSAMVRENKAWVEVKTKQRAPKTERAPEVSSGNHRERRAKNFKSDDKFANAPSKNFQRDNKNAKFDTDNKKKLKPVNTPAPIASSPKVFQAAKPLDRTWTKLFVKDEGCLFSQSDLDQNV